MEKKIVVITGSGGVIGAVCTEEYLLRGNIVFACYGSNNSKAKLDKLKNKFGDQLELIPDFDITSLSSRNSAVAIIKEKTKYVDILINMTGILNVESFFRITDVSLRNLFDINYFSIIEFTQQISKLMLLRKTYDRSIIFISSVSVRLSNPGRLTYIGSKAALEHSSKVLSKELGPYGIRVNTVSPGLIDSNMLTNNTSEPEINNMLSLTPFLSSESALFITGQTICVDGGL